MHIDARLPASVELGAQRTRSFDLEIVSSDSGYEDRTAIHEDPLLRFQVGFPISERDAVVYQAVVDAFDVTGGGRDSFDFEDFAEHSAVDEPFGTGDGVEDTFQLIKTRTFGSETFERRVQRPDTSTLTIKVNGGTLGPSSYSVTDLGEIIFDTPPASMDALTWSGDFWVAVRFDREYTLTAVTPDLDHTDAFSLVEVKLKTSDFAAVS